MIAHELNIDLSIRSIAQKRHLVGEEKALAMRQEVEMLVDTNLSKNLCFKRGWPSDGEEEQRKMEDVRAFQGPKQSPLKGFLSPP